MNSTIHFIRFDIEIKDRSGAENQVADHLSRLDGPLNPLPIRDDFPDEHLMFLYACGIAPWFADIVNYRLHLFYIPMHLNFRLISLRVMLNIMCGVILTY